MIDDIIRPPREPSQAPQGEKPELDEAAVSARRVVSMSDIVQPRVDGGGAIRPQPRAISPEEAAPPPRVRQVRRFQDVTAVAAPPSESVRTTITETFDFRTEYNDTQLNQLLIHTTETEVEYQSVDYFAHLAEKKKEASEKEPSKWTRRRKDFLRYAGAATAAMFILAFTGYVSVDTWVTNSEVKQVVAQQQEKAATNAMILGEGEDEAEVTPNAIDMYQVAADFPRILSIDKLNIRARVLPMSVNADGSMQAPVNIYDSGWYGASAKPGSSGATVIDAHASGATRQGLFAYLDTLKVGDRLSIERGDGTHYTYEVVFSETVHLDEVDMRKLLTPYGSATEGVNLITCTGTWIPEQKTYDHRVVVYTKRV